MGRVDSSPGRTRPAARQANRPSRNDRCPTASCRLGLRSPSGTRRVGIEVTFARLVDDGENVGRAYQSEIGDSCVCADVDHRIQSLDCAARWCLLERILSQRILSCRGLQILIRRHIRRHGGLTRCLRCAASRRRCGGQARENIPARHHAATVRCSPIVATLGRIAAVCTSSPSTTPCNCAPCHPLNLAVGVGPRPIPMLPLPHAFATRNCLLTQFSSRPSRRKRAAVRAAKPRLSRKLSGV